MLYLNIGFHLGNIYINSALKKCCLQDAHIFPFNTLFSWACIEKVNSKTGQVTFSRFTRLSPACNLIVQTEESPGTATQQLCREKLRSLEE